MTRRIRIPGLVDLTRVDEAAVIATVSEDLRLDRDFDGPGPLLNRWLTRRIRRALHVGGTPLSAVAPRHYPGRAGRQAKLEQELAGRLAKAAPAPEQIDRLAAYVRGEEDEDALGPAAQEAIGRLFADDYLGTAKTWRAARILDAAPRSKNPLRLLAWALTGAVGRSRRRLAQAVRDDPAGVHATGIAVHSLVRSLRAMRELWRDKGARNSISADRAAARSLRAPETVLRRWSKPAMTILGEMQPGSLTIFELEAARTRRPGPQTVFMADSWTRCPAHLWTAALLAAVWERAVSPPAQPQLARSGATGAAP